MAVNDTGLVGFIGRLGTAGVDAGTTLLARRAGFLCVISDLSTFRSPFVTASPRFNSAKTADAPPAAGAGGAATGGGGGGGGADAPAVPFVCGGVNELNGTP